MGSQRKSSVCKAAAALVAFAADGSGANSATRKASSGLTGKSMQYENSKLLNYSLYKNFMRATVDCWKDIWDMATRKNTSLGKDAIVYKQGPATIVQRVLLSGLDDYLKGTVPIFIQLANSADGEKWGPGTLHTPMRYIDFSK